MNTTESTATGRVNNQGVVGSLSLFGNDVANLIELQAKLATYDFDEFRGRILVPLAALAVGSVVFLGATPIVLFGMAELLVMFFGLSLGVALLSIGLSALVLAAIVAYLSLQAVTQSTHSFRRSQEEFIRNISWLRTVVIHSGRS